MSDTNGSFRSTPIWKDIESTILSGEKPVKFNTEVQIHTKDNDFNIIKLKEIQEMDNYTQEYMGYVTIRFFLSMGDYAYKLYPFRDMLEVTLKKLPQLESGGQNTQAETTTIRYRATLDLNKNPTITGTRAPTLSYDTLQTSNDVVEVCLELIDRNFEVLRAATVPGKVFNNATPEQLISGLMVGQSQKYLVGGSPAIEAFQIVKPDNTKPMSASLIPSGLKIANVPTFVQEKLSGVYNTGVGTFLARYKGIPAWFVYPLYNTNRFDDDVDRAVIFAVPQDMLSGLDRTYRVIGRVLYIVATGPQVYSDDSKISDVNQGVGVRLADATGIITKPLEITDQGLLGDRARLNTELAGRTRSDGIYYAPTLAPSINPFKAYSRVTARQLSEVNVVWENSLPELVYPGMPVKYAFMDGIEYREVKGTILGKYSKQGLLGAPGTSETYVSSTHLGMMVSYYEDSPEQPIQGSPGRF